MTALSAHRRAGDDRPHRRPAPAGWLAARAALLVLLAFVLAVPTAASAAEPNPVPTPALTGPGAPVPPPAPELPRVARGKAKAERGRKQEHRRAGRGQRPGERRGGVELHASCAAFTHVQSYGAWGPALTYGVPVSVVYEAERCSTPDGSTLHVAAQGTARIYEGAPETGTLLDTRPFLVTGTWREPANAEAWPPAWWACEVSFARYTWQIPGVYTFQVAARDGLWSLDVSSGAEGSEPLHWTHDGCA